MSESLAPLELSSRNELWDLVMNELPYFSVRFQLDIFGYET